MLVFLKGSIIGCIGNVLSAADSQHSKMNP